MHDFCLRKDGVKDFPGWDVACQKKQEKKDDIGSTVLRKRIDT